MLLCAVRFIKRACLFVYTHSICKYLAGRQVVTEARRNEQKSSKRMKEGKPEALPQSSQNENMACYHFRSFGTNHEVADLRDVAACLNCITRVGNNYWTAIDSSVGPYRCWIRAASRRGHWTGRDRGIIHVDASHSVAW